MIFEQTYTPVIEDFTSQGKITLFAILKILENAGNAHSDKSGDSRFAAANTKAWVLTDWQISVDEYPSYGDEIKVQTWSQKIKSPIVASRDFILYKNNQPCVKGTTRWVLFDLAAKRPCKIEQELVNKYGPEDKSVFDDQHLVKIAEPVSFVSEKKVAIRRSDVDFNGHIHNLMYLDYAMESLPEDVYAKQQFTNLRISYKSAVTSEKEIVCKYGCADGKHVVQMTDDNGLLKTIVQIW